MSDTPLIAPHGGLSEPVNRMVADVETVLSAANGLTRVPVSDADLSSVYRFGDGGLSPLTGPMDAQTYHRVLDESVIEVAGKRYAWTIPISLPISPRPRQNPFDWTKSRIGKHIWRNRGGAGHQRHL